MSLELLDDVKSIIKKNEEEINKTGKGFNLISLLGMDENERYCHSNIIAELLNSKGSHTFGNTFFKLFLEQVGISNFNTSNYEVLTEEYVGEVKCGEEEKMRTFLDVVIKDKSTGKVILIENKIWAPDQFEQLDRYYEHYKGKIIKLFYLNVFQHDYKFSLENLEGDLTNDQKIKLEDIKKVYKSITYETLIKNWLSNCIVASTEKPFVNKQIETYYQTILKLTNQDIYKKMSAEIMEKITENLETFEAASEISNKYFETKNMIINNFNKELFSQLTPGEILINNEATLEYLYDDENRNERLYLGFKLKGNWSENFELDLKNLLIEITRDSETSNSNWFFWVNNNDPILKLKNFKNLSNQDLLNLKNDQSSMIANIKLYFESILDKIRKVYPQ